MIDNVSDDSIYYAVEILGDIKYVSKNKGKIRGWINGWIKKNCFSNSDILFIKKIKQDYNKFDFSLEISSKIKNTLWSIEKDLYKINVFQSG